MIPRGRSELPERQRQVMKRAIQLEWLTVFFMLTIVLVIGLTMGSSQAMKAAWIEDLLSLIPPLSFLFAAHFQKHPPDQRFPYGRGRAMSISFLVASTALFAFGLFVLIDSVAKLVSAERPSLGAIELFGHVLWSGWVMVAALIYSVIPPVILGRMKLRLSRELHEKTLHADADMNKADWLTGAAAIAGVFGIGLGLWWLDAVVAGLIALDIVWDGAKNLKRSFGDLMDRVPMRVDRSEPDEISDRLLEELKRLPWVERAEVRLREEGQMVTGEAFVVPRDTSSLPERLDDASRALRQLDWRVGDVVVTATRRLEPER